MVYNENNKDLGHYKSLTKGLTNRIGRFLYDPKIEGRFVSDAKDKVKAIGRSIGLSSSAKEELPKVVGASSGAATLAVTVASTANIIPKANEMLTYVSNIKGKLYDTLHHRYLNSQEAAFYNAVKVLGIPVIEIASLAADFVLPLTAYYVSKKATEKALKSLEEK